MNDSPKIGRLLFPEDAAMRVYESPLAVLTATRIDEVRPALAELERHVVLGRHVAGYIAYEAAPAFDPAFQVHAPAIGSPPMLWFGVYEHADFQPLPTATPVIHCAWNSCMDSATYAAAIERIRQHIAAGDTYQVNFTFPMEARFEADPEAWFLERLRAQQSRCAAFIDLGSHAIMSLSPELFFELQGDRIVTRPMKGTRPRGLDGANDRGLAEDLRSSPKDRAENLMIVDMLRNDLGRVCAVNSIEVSDLFSVERYPTVWQMTSAISGRCHAPVPAIFAALFPCASVTGAPKIETMKIIHDMETGPRGVYCGAIGWWAPERRARFNVAIRTATLDRATGTARYAAGSGVTWDSDADREYRECTQKAAVLHHVQPDFQLLASLRLEGCGYFLLDEHLERMEDSAAYFGYPFNRCCVREALEQYRAAVSSLPAKVRLLSGADGALRIEHTPLPAPGPWKVGLAGAPIDSLQPWTHHKTTFRKCYDTARATRPDCTDVLLWTPEGLLTESTYANLVLRLGERRYTPPLEVGLLAGVFRRYLLETGQIEERPLTVDDLERADEILLINSVRRWIPIEWMPHDDTPDR